MNGKFLKYLKKTRTQTGERAPLGRHLCFPQQNPLREISTGQPARFTAGGHGQGLKACLNMVELLEF